MIFADEAFSSELLKNGVLFLILAVFAIAVWRVVLWARDNVATPVVAAHIGLVTQIKVDLKAQTDALEKIESHISEQKAHLSKIADATSVSAERLGVNSAALQAIRSMTEAAAKEVKAVETEKAKKLVEAEARLTGKDGDPTHVTAER